MLFFLITPQFCCREQSSLGNQLICQLPDWSTSLHHFHDWFPAGMLYVNISFMHTYVHAHTCMCKLLFFLASFWAQRWIWLRMKYLDLSAIIFVHIVSEGECPSPPKDEAQISKLFFPQLLDVLLCSKTRGQMSQLSQLHTVKTQKKDLHGPGTQRFKFD